MQPSHRSKVLFYTGISLIIFVILAFGIVTIVQPFRQERYLKPFVIIHIVAAMSWLVLFAWQSRLILKGNVNRHRKNLNFGIMLVAIVTVFSIIIVYQWGLALRVVGESRDVLTFAILFFASIWFAKKGKLETHKRLMLIASLNLISPAITRVGFIFDWSTTTVVIVSILVWILIPLFYDLFTIRKIHKATIGGITFTLIFFAIMVAIVVSPLLDRIEAFLYPSG